MINRLCVRGCRRWKTKSFGAGLRQCAFIKNDTEYDVSVAFVVNVDGQNGEKYVIGPAEGTYLIDLQGEVSDMEAYTDTSGCGILVPYGFEGYVVLPLP